MFNSLWFNNRPWLFLDGTVEGGGAGSAGQGTGGGSAGAQGAGGAGAPKGTEGSGAAGNGADDSTGDDTVEETVSKADHDQAIAAATKKANREAKSLRDRLTAETDKTAALQARIAKLEGGGAAQGAAGGEGGAAQGAGPTEKDKAQEALNKSRLNNLALKQDFYIKATRAGMPAELIDDTFILMQHRKAFSEVHVDTDDPAEDPIVSGMDEVFIALKKNRPELFKVPSDNPARKGVGETINPRSDTEPPQVVKELAASHGISVDGFLELDAIKIKEWEARGKKDSTVEQRWYVKK